MAYCDECGIRCAISAPIPICNEHGPRWRLVRNAPCAAAVIVREGLVLLSRRARQPWVGEWEVPGGFVERGEHPEEAAVREVHEELGIHVELTGLLGIYTVHHTETDWLQVTVYTATTTDAEPVPDPDEVSEWRWFRPDDIPLAMAADHRQRIDDWMAGCAVPLPDAGSRRSIRPQEPDT